MERLLAGCYRAVWGCTVRKKERAVMEGLGPSKRVNTVEGGGGEGTDLCVNAGSQSLRGIHELSASGQVRCVGWPPRCVKPAGKLISFSADRKFDSQVSLDHST